MNTKLGPTNGKLIYDIIPPKVILASRAATTHSPTKPLLYEDILAELAEFPDFQEPKTVIAGASTSPTRKESLRKLATEHLRMTKNAVRNTNWRVGATVGRFIVFGAILFTSMTASFTTLKALAESSSNTTQNEKPSTAETVHPDTVKPATTQPTNTTENKSATPTTPTITTPTPSTPPIESTPTTESTPQQSSTPQTTTQPSAESSTGSSSTTTPEAGSGTTSDTSTNPSTTPPSETSPPAEVPPIP